MPNIILNVKKNVCHTVLNIIGLIHKLFVISFRLSNKLVISNSFFQVSLMNQSLMSQSLSDLRNPANGGNRTSGEWRMFSSDSDIKVRGRLYFQQAITRNKNKQPLLLGLRRTFTREGTLLELTCEP